MGRILTVKNNKGGVGKSWLTLQIAHILSALENKNNTQNKVLILTSDSQNNILTYSGLSSQVTEGLENFVNNDEHSEIRIRENLYYMPLLNNKFSRQFKDKLKSKILDLKNEYDYILIDSVPVLNIDEDFIEISDKIIIPTFLDGATTEGIIRLLNEIDPCKVLAIVPNRFTKTKIEIEWARELKEILANTDIFISEPIRQSAIITELIQKGKTIWETNSKKAEGFQEIIMSLAGVIVNEKK